MERRASGCLVQPGCGLQADSTTAGVKRRGVEVEVEVERVGQALSVCDDTSRGERCSSSSSSSRGVVLVKLTESKPTRLCDGARRLKAVEILST